MLPCPSRSGSPRACYQRYIHRPPGSLRPGARGNCRPSHRRGRTRLRRSVAGWSDHPSVDHSSRRARNCSQSAAKPDSRRTAREGGSRPRPVAARFAVPHNRSPNVLGGLVVREEVGGKLAQHAVNLQKRAPKGGFGSNAARRGFGRCRSASKVGARRADDCEPVGYLQADMARYNKILLVSG